MLARQLNSEFEELSLSDAEFRWFADQLRQRAGISLNESKQSLLKGRLRPRLKALELSSYSSYKRYLQSLSKDHPEWETFINALTTNKTDWFREPQHFDFLLKKYLPRWRKTGRKQLNVWSVACSTGEEPYTLALLLKHHMLANESFHICATDIDSNVLSRARNGVYPRAQIELQVPQDYINSAFSAGTEDIADWMRVKNRIREHVSFRQLNLLDIPEQWPRDFDVAFCRNVLIYFDHDTVTRVVNRIWQHCRMDSMFAVGHSESLQNIQSRWQFAQPSVYLKSDDSSKKD